MTIDKSIADHDHSTSEKSALNETNKDAIIGLANEGLAPAKIRNMLRARSQMKLIENFQKGSLKNMCKHITVAMCETGICTFPSGASALPLQGQKKRGRPKDSEVGRPAKMQKQVRHVIGERANVL